MFILLYYIHTRKYRHACSKSEKLEKVGVLLRVCISAGTLLWIYRRLIGRSYIALAQQDQYIGNISDPLGRLRS